MVYMLVISISEIKFFIDSFVENIDTNDKMICPAVILAASQKLRVSGRTTTLINSIKIRNGPNQSGAVSGNRCPICLFFHH